MSDVSQTQQTIGSSDGFRAPALEVGLEHIDLHMKRKHILKDVSCSFRPGKMTLILGPPGCGKSSLLKLAAGYYTELPYNYTATPATQKGDKKKNSKNKKAVGFAGSLNYSGLEASQIRVRNLIGYLQQYNQDIPTLTVRETLRFAVTLKAMSHYPAQIHQETTSHSIIDAKVDALLETLGLVKCANTIIGDETMRGISGGEQKRVSLGEVLAGGYSTLFLDEFSTGLDASATLDITEVLQRYCKEDGYTIAAALLQPTPEVFELFDDVIVLSKGRVVYNGPRENLLSHFESLGYRCPDRIDVADFIQLVTTDDNVLFRTTEVLRDPTPRPTPKTPLQFAEEFQLTELYRKTIEDLRRGPSTRQYQAHELPSKAFRLPWYTYFHNVFYRDMTMFRRDLVILRTRIMQSLFMGVLVGTLFFHIAENEFQTKINFIWYNVAFLSSLALTRIPALIVNRPVYYRQQRSNYYPTWTYAVSGFLTQLPINFIEAVVFGSLVYWLGGLAPSASIFMYFLLVMFIQNVANNQLMQITVAVAPDAVVAQSLGGMLVLLTMVYGGFVIGEPIIPKGWLWAFWMNPLSYAFRSLTQNEFLKSGDYNGAPPGVPPGVQVETTQGELYLETYGISTDLMWYWLGPIMIVTLMAVYTLFYTFALGYFTYSSSSKQEGAGNQKYDDEEEEEESSTEVEEEEAVVAYAVKDLEAVTPSTEADAVTTEVPFFDGTATISPSRIAVVPSQKFQSFRLMSSALGRSGDANALNTSFMDRVPFVPTTLTWRDLRYSVTVGGKADDGKKNQKVLLSQISGMAAPGRMLALMGASGAGKTTLLDVLARRKNTGTVEGEMLFNGSPVDDRTFRQKTAYVEQFDRISSTSTVVESLQFSANLRLPAEMPDEVRAQFVENILQVLELEAVRDTLGSQLSLSQRKKLSLGIELVANPSILFLDEPTSGLDSRAALNVMKVVRKVSRLGRTIICTIHQPSTLLFERFDDLLLLQSGRIAYSGPLGEKGIQMVEYLLQIPETTAPYSKGLNPASWMLDVIGAGVKGQKVVLDNGKPSKAAPLLLEEGGIGASAAVPVSKGEKYIRFYEQSELKGENDKALQAFLESRQTANISVMDATTHKSICGFFHSRTSDDKSTPTPRASTSDYNASFFRQLRVILTRLWRMNLRMPEVIISKAGVFTFLCIVLGTTYSSIGYDNITTTTELIAMLSSLFLVAQACWIISCLPEMIPVDLERQLFDKERSSNYYSVVPYTIAWGLVKIPLNFVYATVFINVVYWTVGYNTNDLLLTFGWFYVLLFLVMVAGNMAALMIVAFSPTLEIANLLGGLIFNLNALFVGLMISYNSMTKVWSWFYWINPLHYFYEGLVVSQFRDDNRLIASPATGGTISVSEFIDFFFNGSFSYDNIEFNAVMLVVFSVAFLVIFGVTIKFVNHLKR